MWSRQLNLKLPQQRQGEHKYNWWQISFGLFFFRFHCSLLVLIKMSTNKKGIIWVHLFQQTKETFNCFNQHLLCLCSDIEKQVWSNHPVSSRGMSFAKTFLENNGSSVAKMKYKNDSTAQLCRCKIARQLYHLLLPRGLNCVATNKLVPFPSDNTVCLRRSQSSFLCVYSCVVVGHWLIGSKCWVFLLLLVGTVNSSAVHSLEVSHPTPTLAPIHTETGRKILATTVASASDPSCNPRYFAKPWSWRSN